MCIAVPMVERLRVKNAHTPDRIFTEAIEVIELLQAERNRYYDDWITVKEFRDEKYVEVEKLLGVAGELRCDLATRDATIVQLTAALKSTSNILEKRVQELYDLRNPAGRPPLEGTTPESNYNDHQRILQGHYDALRGHEVVLGTIVNRLDALEALAHVGQSLPLSGADAVQDKPVASSDSD